MATSELSRGRGLEVLDIAGMRAADAWAMEFGVASRALMEHAGAAVAEAAQRMLERREAGRRVLVLAGPGNNGGDGFVAARILKEAGCLVRVALLGERAELAGDAAWAAGEWDGEVSPIDAIVEAGEAAFHPYDLVIDALFGAGLRGPLQGSAAAVAALLAQARQRGEVRVLAVDVPSGVNGDSGKPPEGGLAVAADMTVTFFRKKPAHLLHPGRALCGEVRVADIGIPERVFADAGIRPVAHENAPPLWRAELPELTRGTHKYHRGSLMVLSGDALHTGASRLAALAGFRAGAGAVTLAGDHEALRIQAAHMTEVMLHPVENALELVEAVSLKHVGAMLIGPAAGVTEAVRDMTLAVLERVRRLPVVLDADVFSVFQADPEVLFSAIGKRRGPVVMTPHEGEFARMFPDLAHDHEGTASKLERTREAAGRAGCVVLLKGPDTVIADAKGNVVIASNAPPWLATAGAGDVLAGIIGGLLAQRMPALAATAAAAHIHARAAWRAGPAMVAGDMIGHVGEIRAELGGEEARWKEA